MTVARLSEVIRQKALPCSCLNHELLPLSVFSEELHKPYGLSIKIYWEAHKRVALQNVAEQATSLFKLDKRVILPVPLAVPIIKTEVGPYERNIDNIETCQLELCKKNKV